MSFACDSCVQKCRIIVHLCDSMIYAIVSNTYMIIWYINVYSEFVVLYVIFTDMCATQFHECLALSVAFCCLWAVNIWQSRTTFKDLWLPPRSPAAALRQQQILCGCPCSLRNPNMNLEFQRTRYWLHAKVFHHRGSGFWSSFFACDESMTDLLHIEGISTKLGQ